MDKVILDGRRMERASQSHQYLKEKLELPDYYGENLDALYDLLTECPRTTEICIKDSFHMDSLLYRVFKDAARDNECLNIIWA